MSSVTFIYTAEEFEGARSLTKSCSSDVQIVYKTAWLTKEVYVCPRGISVDAGNPSACGGLCRKTQGDEDDEFVDEHVLKRW
ncbi:hypothetical protein G647_03834 [Cladophialophora carrionii CBS 160.54]|uniref:Uncharacterized protein n=1 Tax=Cladophialophora carrionii CBS 160.54 TaxID=1279043 RepID=V9DCA1_9EURO|nr:uncharacterized protein G647_03834 [Cladophialophora carrionii CBS 160.54]ETI24465.1 hypothetical protein G647_03834 [Cladophialophora carrionii CBS 160.54]